jgi:hypothetical protein
MTAPPQTGIVDDVDASFRDALEAEDAFNVRRAMERLREGLFDPVAVRLLTAHEERLKGEVERDFRAVDAGKSPHLCIVGAYGQGKSHSLVYIQDMALREGFAVSRINLDPREVPFQSYREVYRELMGRLRIPASGASFPALWRKWAQQQIKEREDLQRGVLDILPNRMPHYFKAVLAAMAHGNISLSEREKKMKKHAAFRPKEFPTLLARALTGETVPIQRLINIFKYREVSFYRDGSLSCRGVEPYFLMTQALSQLFKEMGYRGWVLLFDEGESITQVSVFARSKSYRLLHRMFGVAGDSEPTFLYPVFAFTDDFFQRVQQEDYDKILVRGEQEIPYFDRNYARAWQSLNTYRLHDLTRKEWEELSRKLISLHAKAYDWQPPEDRVAHEMASRLEAMHNQETRLKLKALVDSLDLAQQEQVL